MHESREFPLPQKTLESFSNAAKGLLDRETPWLAWQDFGRHLQSAGLIESLLMGMALPEGFLLFAYGEHESSSPDPFFDLVMARMPSQDGKSIRRYWQGKPWIGEVAESRQKPPSSGDFQWIQIDHQNEWSGCIGVKWKETDGSAPELKEWLLKQPLDLFGHLLHRTRYDGLTRLLTRKAFEGELESIWLSTRTQSLPLHIILVDIDHFKRVNDTYGHLAGDELLVELSGLLKGAFPGSNMLGRFGGDEFYILDCGDTEKKLWTKLEELRETVASHSFLSGEHSIHITLSMGVANSSEWADSDYRGFLARADLALLRAKRLGRNRIEAFQDGSHKRPLPLRNGISAEEELPPSHVLLADDNEELAQLVSDFLGQFYEVDLTHTLEDTYNKVQAHPGLYDVLVLDINFPGGTGIELLNRLQELPDPPLAVMITGIATAEHAIQCLRQGAYDFLPKPFRLDQLHNSVRRACELRRLRFENARYQNNLEDMVRERSAALTAALAETERSYRFTLEALVVLLSHRSDETLEHSRRVRRISLLLGEAMGYSGKEREDLDKGALLHDIGKLAIPDSILDKPGPLDDREWEVMRRHPGLGFDALKSNPYLQVPARMVLEHHERYDGSGYPANLKGDEISLGARIFAVADVYDALRSRRSYKEPMAPDQARRFLSEHAGSMIEPAVVEAFLNLGNAIEETGQWPEP